MIFFFVCTKCTKLRICFSYFENTILRGKNTIFKLYSYNEQSYLGNSDLIPTLFCMKGGSRTIGSDLKPHTSSRITLSIIRSIVLSRKDVRLIGLYDFTSSDGLFPAFGM